MALFASFTHTHTPHTSEPPSSRRTATRDQASMYSRDSAPGVVAGLACWMAPDQTAQQACRGDPAVLHGHKIGWLTTATARFISFLARLWSVMMENSAPRVPSPWPWQLESSSWGGSSGTAEAADLPSEVSGDAAAARSNAWGDGSDFKPSICQNAV